MTDNPRDPASTDVDAVVLSIDAEMAASEADEASPAAPAQGSRPTKLDRPASARNTVLDLPRQDGPAEASACPAPVAQPAQAQRQQPMSREALIDAVFTAPGAMEWLTQLALALSLTGSTEGYEGYDVPTAETQQQTRQVTQI